MEYARDAADPGRALPALWSSTTPLASAWRGPRTARLRTTRDLADPPVPCL